ncbi:pyridoxamine 5'-phosphate oxidase family protein [Nocardiopsis alborubida]|uniref:Pyridoxamine 5'-phosphate oxidase n=1 Tax=Nocardiopsis alborubida TaxID=146802 RepID=A0A7X6RS37_9ACTN|nr:pyridoxamine 5'-phosphate oxidase family protein [Nocardiopsis alborubida]NKY99896.1 pyridoxamine 5'-phosphate oxidase [Nocardiopsis alborubida]
MTETTVPAPEALAGRLGTDRNAWLCTLRRDGSPHVTPVWFAHLRDRWWISVDARSVKARNAAADPRVSLALEDGDVPVVAEGRTRVHTDGFPGDVVAAFRDKYDYDIRTPIDTRDEPRALLEIRVTRWLMSGAAH